MLFARAWFVSSSLHAHALPQFLLRASDEALEASVEHRETSTEQLEESQGGQQVVFLTETASEQGAGSDQEN
jgi:hypothetical protein